MGVATIESRRYLTRFDVARMGQIFTDVLVIGGGVAGMRAGIEAARHGDVLLIAKQGLRESNTAYAQGGIAAALGREDGPESHLADTLAVGCGLCDGQVVQRMVARGPSSIQELVEWGAGFDRDAEGEISLGREAAHSHARVVHGYGDATGLMVFETLGAKSAGVPNMRIFENCFVVDLLTHEGRCRGAVSFHEKYGLQVFWAKEVILATGGMGRIYRETTNPPVATADGHAMGYRAGAVVRDMEFMQFHPTTLYVAGAARALISEAVRGEGAHLVTRDARRFMPEYHELAELAPRDVVSRAIVKEMAEGDYTHVFLDVRHLGADRFRARFPGITRLCEGFGIDVGKDLIPVRPSAHYMIGGLRVDGEARTSVPNLWACGEAASTGVHGANRLASNSLLEGLVFGQIAGREAGLAAASHPEPTTPVRIVSEIDNSRRTELDLPDVMTSLRSVMWRNVGITRDGDRLAETIEIIGFWARYTMDKVFDSPAEWEAQNMLTGAWLMSCGALARTESRGVHYRSDVPETRPDWARHIELVRPDES